ncbi:hypothetical protein AVEN_216361-1 [Araneus ventricosus]|uniref:Uncharacterized protein n=1 Tax=Araneus ventricosus TaxID=182803 RepID=A0A4Y2GY24_ARAVE|nr:hypothetical protein AVEN_216361-1 [Araneus ventricosus]
MRITVRECRSQYSTVFGISGEFHQNFLESEQRSASISSDSRGSTILSADGICTGTESPRPEKPVDVWCKKKAEAGRKYLHVGNYPP